MSYLQTNKKWVDHIHTDNNRKPLYCWNIANSFPICKDKKGNAHCDNKWVYNFSIEIVNLLPNHSFSYILVRHYFCLINVVLLLILISYLRWYHIYWLVLELLIMCKFIIMMSVIAIWINVVIMWRLSILTGTLIQRDLIIIVVHFWYVNKLE